MMIIRKTRRYFILNRVLKGIFFAILWQIAMYAIIYFIVMHSSLAHSQTVKHILDYKRISTREIAITCNNNGDPTGIKHGDVLYISCGK